MYSRDGGVGIGPFADEETPETGRGSLEHSRNVRRRDIALKGSNIININRILKLHGWLRGPDEAPSGITVG